MAWGNASNIITTNLDDATDSPASARSDLKAALDELSAVISGRNTANGVAGLSATSKILATYLPDEINSSATNPLTLDPATGKVKLEEILNLKPQTAAQLNARTDKTAGDVAYCSDDGTDSGSTVPVIAVFDGTNWKKIALGGTL